MEHAVHRVEQLVLYVKQHVRKGCAQPRPLHDGDRDDDRDDDDDLDGDRDDRLEHVKAEADREGHDGVHSDADPAVRIRQNGRAMKIEGRWLHQRQHQRHMQQVQQELPSLSVVDDDDVVHDDAAEVHDGPHDDVVRLVGSDVVGRCDSMEGGPVV